MTITQRVVERARALGVSVLEREDWGTQQAPVYKSRRRRTKAGEWGPFTMQADTLVQHITVTNPTSDFRADCRTIERIGMERFGSGVSYNFLVNMETGKVAVGQPLDSKGTHTVNDKGVPGFSHDQNLVARAIAVVGMPNTVLTSKAQRAIALLSQAMVEEGALTPGYDYVPHSLFAFKDCPCASTRTAMPQIRGMVNKVPTDRKDRAIQEHPGDSNG